MSLLSNFSLNIKLIVKKRNFTLPLSLFHFLLPISFLPILAIFFLPLFNPIFEKFFAERAMMQKLHLRLLDVQKLIKASFASFYII